VIVPDEADEDCAMRLRRLREAFGDRGYMALSLRRRPNDQLRPFELSNLATSMRVPSIVTNDVLFHEPRRRILQNVVTCIRHNVTIDELGDRKSPHASRSGAASTPRMRKCERERADGMSPRLRRRPAVYLGNLQLNHEPQHSAPVQ
jgi:DNA polymerase III alpha subunit